LGRRRHPTERPSLITEHDVRIEHENAVASLSSVQRRAFERELMRESSSWCDVDAMPSLKMAFAIEAAARNARPSNDNDRLVSSF
jgi:hypothetical protein